MTTVLEIFAGLLLLAFTWSSVVFTLVLPRAQRGFGRVGLRVNKLTRGIFLAIAKLPSTYERKDALLAPIGPVAVLAQLAIWLVLLGTAFVVSAKSMSRSTVSASSAAPRGP